MNNLSSIVRKLRRKVALSAFIYKSLPMGLTLVLIAAYAIVGGFDRVVG